ncbi:MAG: HAD-IA family hydrolase [Elusimicrobia bacterium]|nr:HAD-IA family hydrolase [Elusimicrobiota bacterium]
MGWRRQMLFGLLWALALPSSAGVQSKVVVEPVGELRLGNVSGMQTPGVGQGITSSLVLNTTLSGNLGLVPAVHPDLKPVVAINAPAALPTPLVPISGAPAPAAVIPQSPAMPFPTARGPPQSQAELPSEVSAFLASAKSAPDSEETRGFLASLPARFDGMSHDERGAVLAGLEDAAKSAPKALHLRKALQALIVRDEVELVEPRLRNQAISAARKEDVASKTAYQDVRWYHHFLPGIVHPEADGVAQREDLSINLHVKKGWEKMPSFTAFYRALFAHEYTHRLQFEGHVTEKLGMEIPPVGTEILRGIELVGLEGLRQGLIGFITESVLSGFDQGQKWMRSEQRAEGHGLYWKGFLAGAAYELAFQTGRWADAWAFHRQVSAGKSLQEAEKAVRASDPISKLTSRRPDAVLFDWDNTMVDERGVVDAIRMRLFSELGVPTPTLEEANRMWRTDRDAFYDGYFPGISRDKVNSTYYAIMERVRREKERSGEPLNPLLPGVKETLAALKRQGVPLAVVSNKPHEQLVRELKTLGLEDAFSYVQGHTEARELKPSPQPIVEAMKAMGVAGGNVWYVGDELGDLAAAHGAGAQGIFFGTRDADVVRQGAAGEVVQVDDHRQFLDAVVKKLPH